MNYLITAIFGILLCLPHILPGQNPKEFPIELDNGQTFYPGRFTLDNQSSESGHLHFDRHKQRLLILVENDVIEYSASAVSTFHYMFQSGTPYAEEVQYITWKYQREWPEYERMTFFQVLADYYNCAIVSSDRKPQVIDQYPDSSEVFMARIAQGKNFHLILPDGSVVEYNRQTVDENLHLILEDDYAEVMLYAHEHGLQPTRFVDLFSILDYAETLRRH